MHNDTKVNNILFSSTTQKAACAIDLDTLMPGYFIYDLGDMVRTFVSPVSEEEKDTSKIQFRKNIYDALLRGYLSEMNDVLTNDEKKSIPFSGLMMTYIMALRMLADFLRGNTYYHITYPEQNLVRSRNQLHLLGLIRAAIS
jgi:Ser/Thr protein kinase RdoA (MazF antagonist)